MENVIQTIRKGQRVPIVLEPNVEVEFNVQDYLDYYMDTFELRYDKKYQGQNVAVAYTNADGHKYGISKILENPTFISWMNSETVANPICGQIVFSCRLPVAFEFIIK
jgi:hypothetical protein